jgi:hypothetical protein
MNAVSSKKEKLGSEISVYKQTKMLLEVKLGII